MQLFEMNEANIYNNYEGERQTEFIHDTYGIIWEAKCNLSFDSLYVIKIVVKNLLKKME